MATLGTLFRDGLRVAAFRKPRHVALDVGFGPTLAFAFAGLLIGIAFSWLYFAAPRTYNAYGLQSFCTDAFLTLFASWLLARIARRPALVWLVSAWVFAAAIPIGIVHWIFTVWGWKVLLPAHPVVATVINWAFVAWWLAALARLASALGAPLARALAAGLVSVVVSDLVWGYALTPQYVIQHDYAADYARRKAEAEKKAAEQKAAHVGGAAFDAEDVIYDQQRLLDEAVAKLKPQTPGKVDLYVIAFAGDGEENVFRNEAEYAEQLFGKRFDADGHVLVLENNPGTVESRPLATLTNLTWALDDVAKKMDPNEDVLLVFLTSHGSHDHELYVHLDPLPLDQIGPTDLADALRTTPSIRWKVLVVSACYSGGFVDALRDDSTLVITAARADRTSFGCGASSDITYFGKAFLADALNKTSSFHEAFDLASRSIARWEDRDQQVHSEPQIASSPRIEAKLAQWQKQLKLGPRVAFVPAVPHDAKPDASSDEADDDDDDGDDTAASDTRAATATSAASAAEKPKAH